MKSPALLSSLRRPQELRADLDSFSGAGQSWSSQSVIATIGNVYRREGRQERCGTIPRIMLSAGKRACLVEFD